MTRSASRLAGACTVAAGALVAAAVSALVPDARAAAQQWSDVDTAAIPAELPRNNMTMNQVRQRYGEPQAQRQAVGDPPITRWVYPGYTVYFEHDRVLVPVRHDRPLP